MVEFSVVFLSTRIEKSAKSKGEIVYYTIHILATHSTNIKMLPAFNIILRVYFHIKQPKAI